MSTIKSGKSGMRPEKWKYPFPCYIRLKDIFVQERLEHIQLPGLHVFHTIQTKFSVRPL